MISSGDDGPQEEDSFEYAYPGHGNSDESHTISEHNSNSNLMNSNATVFYKGYRPLRHLYYQISQLLILLLLLMNLNKRQRLLITLYAVCQSLWGWFVLQSMDVFVWGIVIGVFNLLSALWSVSIRWHLSFGEYENVYKKLFAPLHVNRRQFKKILDCKRNIKILHSGDSYCREKITRVDSLALLLTGRLLVSQNGKALHVICPYQFVDSPEYFGVSTDELFQVTITAIEDSSKLIVWHRDKLRLTIMNDDFLRIAIDHIVGRDVVRKLLMVSDSVSNLNGTTTHLFSKEPLLEENYINENDPMLDRKNHADLQRKFIGNNNSQAATDIFSLTVLKETDEETPV